MEGLATGNQLGNSSSDAGDLTATASMTCLWAQNAGPDVEGRSYVFFGRQDFGAAVDLAALNSADGVSGVVLTGGLPTDISLATLGASGIMFTGEAQFDGVGLSVAGIGDLNNDGLADIATGAPIARRNVFNDGTPEGAVSEVYVIFGAADLAGAGSL